MHCKSEVNIITDIFVVKFLNIIIPVFYIFRFYPQNLPEKAKVSLGAEWNYIIIIW